MPPCPPDMGEKLGVGVIPKGFERVRGREEERKKETERNRERHETDQIRE